MTHKTLVGVCKQHFLLRVETGKLVGCMVVIYHFYSLEQTFIEHDVVGML